MNSKNSLSTNVKLSRTFHPQINSQKEMYQSNIRGHVEVMFDRFKR